MALPRHLEDSLKSYYEVVEKLDSVGLKTEEISGVSDEYYEFIGCTDPKVPDTGSPWIFTASNMWDYITKAEVYIKGIERGKKDGR